MKTIIAGSRSTDSYSVVSAAIRESGFEISEVVSGGARGVDRHGERWGHENKIPVKRFAANWRDHGRAGGPIRNSEMVKYADALIAIWDGYSRGTLDTIRKAEAAGLMVFVYGVRFR